MLIVYIYIDISRVLTQNKMICQCVPVLMASYLVINHRIPVHHIDGFNEVVSGIETLLINRLYLHMPNDYWPEVFNCCGATPWLITDSALLGQSWMDFHVSFWPITPRDQLAHLSYKSFHQSYVKMKPSL